MYNTYHSRDWNSKHKNADLVPKTVHKDSRAIRGRRTIINWGGGVHKR